MPYIFVITPNFLVSRPEYIVLLVTDIEISKSVASFFASLTWYNFWIYSPF